MLANKVSHLWTSENLNSYSEYVYDQTENDLLSLKASEILCALSKNSNIYFMFVFNTTNALEFELDEDASINPKSMKKSLINNSLLQNLIEKMIFHENQNISFNYCLLSTRLLTLQAKNLNRNKKLQNINIDYFKNLFELTKNGLFSIIIECDKAIEELINKFNQSTDDQQHLLNNTKHLKVIKREIFYYFFLILNDKNHKKLKNSIRNSPPK